MAINAIEYLEWDSQFFGYPVARIVFDQQGCDSINSLFQILTSERVRLTYFFVPVSETKLNRDIAKNGSILVDQKTLFSKQTESHTQFANKIIEFSGNEINGRLVELALQAGLFSRFHLDTNFNNNEYERLYVEWLKKSINKKIALKTFIAMNGSEVVGITTLGERSKIAEIGLVAVYAKSRGLGIATDLIHFTDNAAFDLGYGMITIVTQLRNKVACRLYEKCNFQMKNITNIYHYWQ